MQYGVSFSDPLRATENNQPEPKPSLEGPTKDGFVGKPTFVVDTNEKNVTVIWGELPEDVELRKNAKERGLPKRWSHLLRQPAKVDSPMQRTNHHEDAETVFG